MGALTLKSFPFELRGWDVQKFISTDPTDGFGSNTRVYISKQQIIQIEPNCNENSYRTWLSDKGRQFFDGISEAWNYKNKKNKDLILKKKSWKKNIKSLFKMLYLFEHSNTKTKQNYFLTIIIENSSFETLSLLNIMERNYPFLKLRRAEKTNSINTIEFYFLLNSATNFNQLKLSTLSLLVSTNPRNEGYHLNLDLRQRYLKGNFRCLIIGPFLELTFPSTSIGTTLKTLKTVVEGNCFVCQDFKTAVNPLLIFGNELSKRTDGANIMKMFKTFKYANIFNKTWNGLNSLSLTLNEVGMQSITNFLPLHNKDFDEFSAFYFINVNAEQVPNLKKIAEAKLLRYNIFKGLENPNIQRLFFDQNSNVKKNKLFWENSLNKIDFSSYRFLPTGMFYENKETFLNTEGLVKRTNKLITKKGTREGWKLLRNLSKSFKTKYASLNIKNNELLFLNIKKQSDFLNFINLHYCAVEKLDNSWPSLVFKNQPFFSLKANNIFKKKSTRLENTRIKYLIDDFFTGGKDEYTRNSLILANSSKILRTQSATFF